MEPLLVTYCIVLRSITNLPLELVYPLDLLPTVDFDIIGESQGISGHNVSGLYATVNPHWPRALAVDCDIISELSIGFVHVALRVLELRQIKEDLLSMCTYDHCEAPACAHPSFVCNLCTQTRSLYITGI